MKPSFPFTPQTRIMHAIAEHIEDEETLHHLAGLGINYGQGYYFGKPVSIHERAWEGVGRAYGREVPGETGGCRV